jgi:NAD(P)-dependent dehydrogenase (short-subunit alcohol dehydrogenase family)
VQGASAVETNGNLDILINNAYIGNIKFENTGNWQNWELFKLENIYIEKGIDQILQLNFNGTNFNINWIIFEKME